MVESYHWHLDVTFHEDDNRTLEKQAAYNLNILRKISLNLIKVVDIGKKASLKLKRYVISMNPIKYLEPVNIKKRIENESKEKERIKNNIKFIVSGKNTSKSLHSVKYAFHFISFFIQNFIV
jgi:hypothetical protein